MTDDATQDLISVKMACSVMYRYKPEQMLWHYEHGLVLQSIYTVGKKYNLPELTVWVKNMYDTKIQADGSILTYRKDEFNLDQINPGKLLFDLYEETGEERYRAAIETLQNQLRKHPRTNSGGFWHKKIYPWHLFMPGMLHSLAIRVILKMSCISLNWCFLIPGMLIPAYCIMLGMNPAVNYGRIQIQDVLRIFGEGQWDGSVWQFWMCWIGFLLPMIIRF